MVERIEREHPGNRMLYYGQSAAYDEFVAQTDEELLRAAETVG